MLFSKGRNSCLRVACTLAVLAMAGLSQHAVSQSQATASKSWSAAAAGLGDNSHYVPLTQITKANVKNLKVAWTYPTGDSVAYTFEPLVVGDRMYVMAHNNSMVCLDAATGKEIWVHERLAGISNRGMTYWQSPDGKDKRLVFAIHHQLQEIDATTGKSVLTFGSQGFVDLRVGLDRPLAEIFRIQAASPAKIYDNLIIIGSATGENYMAPPGDLRAYDVRTGKLAWQFHTIPRPGEPGYETWQKDAYKYVGGGNVWGDISIDQKRGIAYFPTSSGKYELYGGDRPGANLYTDCMLALDARTGKLKWYFQMIHHDIWDWDNVSAPQLMTVKHDGKNVDIVAEAGKTGFVYVFDRETGKPLWPIEERPVPQTDLPGEKTSPTQPFPTVVPPFARQAFTAKDVNPYLSAQEQADLKAQITAATNGPLFTPPKLGGDTVQMPGNRGGSNWGTTSSNPGKGFFYVAGYDAPAMLHMTDVAPGAPTVVAASSGKGSSGLELYSQNCAVCHGPGRAGEIGPSLIGIDKRRTVDSIKSVMENGQGQMPSFAGLGDAKINAIAEYIYSPDLKVMPGASGGPGRVATEVKPLEDPNVVASGGAPAGLEAPGAKLVGAGPYGSMAGLPYPDGTIDVKRYYTNWNVSPSIIGPPWTSLVAYDMNTGGIRWRIPLGDDPLLAPQGILNTGIRQEQRGIMPTATGLIFVGTSDGKLRAIDDDNGKLIWSTDMPGANRAVPAMYEVSGREYIVLSATTRVGAGVGAVVGGASPVLPPPAPDAPKPAYVVYALPEKGAK